jgi:hypothetical protein
MHLYLADGQNRRYFSGLDSQPLHWRTTAAVTALHLGSQTCGARTRSSSSERPSSRPPLGSSQQAATPMELKQCFACSSTLEAASDAMQRHPCCSRWSAVGSSSSCGASAQHLTVPPLMALNHRHALLAISVIGGTNAIHAARQTNNIGGVPRGRKSIRQLQLSDDRLRLADRQMGRGRGVR